MAATLAIFFEVKAEMNKFADIAAQLIAKQTLCDDVEAVEDLIENLTTSSDGVRVLSFVNAHAVMRSMREPDFFKDLMQSHWLLRDGTGMAMIMRRIGAKPGLNLNGTDFIPLLLEHVPRSRKLALMGTQQPYLGLAARRLHAMEFDRISTLNGFQPEETYVDHARRENPDLIVLAMGMPKQERVSRRIAQDTQFAARDMLIVNGGAILDFLSREVPRAPSWMRRWGIEWLYRLLREPRRMYSRFRDSLAFAVLTQIHAKTIRTRLSTQTKGKTLD